MLPTSELSMFPRVLDRYIAEICKCCLHVLSTMIGLLEICMPSMNVERRCICYWWPTGKDWPAKFLLIAFWQMDTINSFRRRQKAGTKETRFRNNDRPTAILQGWSRWRSLRVAAIFPFFNDWRMQFPWLLDSVASRKGKAVHVLN